VLRNLCPYADRRGRENISDGGMVQDGHKDFRAIDGIMSKTLKEISD